MKNIKFKIKFIAAFLVIGIVPLCVLGFISIKKSEKALEEKAFSQLKNIRAIKKSQIENFFQERTSDIIILAEIIKDFQKNNDLERTAFYLKYLKKYNYYDLFLINPKGKVFYTVKKESDFNTNMLDGIYSSSNLARVFKKVLRTKKTAIADFEPYKPSKDKPEAFIAQPILDKKENVVMVLALQLSLEAINSIMQQREGMGTTGETYLVGSDYLMRSDSFLDPSNHSVRASFANPSKGKVKTEASKDALDNGKTAEKIIKDYNGNFVLSAYTLVEISKDIKWALIAEIDEKEAFATIDALKFSMTIVLLVCVVVIVVIALFFTQTIVSAIHRIVVFAEKMAEGDFTKLLDIDQKDEIGILAKAFNKMVTELGQMFLSVNKGVEDLNISSGKLLTVSEEMKKRAESVSGKANSVSAATEEMSTNIMVL